ncbi:hypothetical protein CYMTET_25495 [Cymbomonas tetramitiformis]|uniref:Uncharacterized protein n=1 Tax=Cymbomonas tetramitiformis TaxID=36881 RepID=A0AAE0FUE9_9CHLO|nr:hypothetical protein CYMTET_25495 [Cymbomonas tetramitiformis]
MRELPGFAVDPRFGGLPGSRGWASTLHHPAVACFLIIGLCAGDAPGAWIRAWWADEHRLWCPAIGWDEVELEAAEETACGALQQEAWAAQRCGTLYLGYRADAWYFEVVELGRKLVYSGLLLFVEDGSLAQIVAAMLFALATLQAPGKQRELLVARKGAVRLAWGHITFMRSLFCRRGYCHGTWEDEAQFGVHHALRCRLQQ